MSASPDPRAEALAAAIREALAFSAMLPAIATIPRQTLEAALAAYEEGER